MARKTKEEAQETRKSILLAALDLFVEKGYARTTFVDIAKRIGMTKGAVYWHFSDKSALLAAVISEMRDREETLIAESVPEVNSLEDLKAYFMAEARVITEDQLCRKFVYFVSLQMEWSEENISRVHDELMAIREQPFDNLEEYLRQAVRSGEVRADLDVGLATDILIGLWRGLVVNHLSGLFTTDLTIAVERAMSLYLNSIRA